MQGVSLADRYRLDEPVASGSAGQVWRAVDLVLERQVAVKLLRPDAAGDPEARARFRAEARNASRLSHPGVAQVHDYGEDHWADRSYGAADPEGHHWWFTQRIRDPKS